MFLLFLILGIGSFQSIVQLYRSFLLEFPFLALKGYNEISSDKNVRFLFSSVYAYLEVSQHSLRINFQMLSQVHAYVYFSSSLYLEHL